jgi:hypothetical protein
MQLGQCANSNATASLRLAQCTGHQGVTHLESAPQYNIKALRCSNCSGCKECRQRVPLMIPEGTGGSGCSAEVAEKAQFLENATAQAVTGFGGTQGQGQEQQGRAGSVSVPSKASNTDHSGYSTGTPNNDPVECAVCHSKPGDFGVPATLKLCGACLQVRYCSAECQRKDWKLGHKAVCQELSKQL